MRSTKLCAALLAFALPLAACDDQGSDDPTTEAPLQKGSSGSSDSSLLAVVIDVAFSAEVRSSYCWSPKQTIQDQLLYTMGQLNGHNSVGRLDKADITNIKSTQDGTTCKITYDVRLPVAWGKKNNVPKELEIVLPKDHTYEGIEAFATKYSHTCVDAGAHDVDSGSMWYYFRPLAGGCSLATEDVVRAKAKVSVSPVNTTGKYPEYDKVWEDDQLRVLAVFGKYEDGATSNDAGIDAYNRFIQMVKTELKNSQLVTVPATVPTNPGVAMPEVTLSGTLEGGKSVTVTALMVDNVREMGSAVDARYEELSSRADLIVYNGHAGLGANVRALAQKGAWVEGQYVIIFINGCDTYAYIDTALFDAHAEVNDDDPDGTKHADIVTNAMPSFFSSMAGATSAIMRGLLAYKTPRTYERIFADIDSAEVVIVTGEHDNTYMPGAGGTPSAWTGIDQKGRLQAKAQQRFATPTLAAGKYRFTLSGTKDVDLYVRIGSEPSLDAYDCRPYLNGSAEVCDVTLSAPAVVNVLLDAYTGPADFRIVGAVR